MGGLNKEPMKEEFEVAQEGDTDLDKTVAKWGELHELVYEYLILNTSASVGKMAFWLMRNVKSQEFTKGNWQLAWDRLVHEYAPHTASSLLKLRMSSTTANLTQWKHSKR